MDEDILIAQRSGSNGLGSTISLGGGNDLLALDAIAAGGYSFNYDNGYATNLVTDFTPAQDQIGIIVPQAAQSSVSVTITPNIAGGYTDVIITLPGPISSGDPNAHPPQTYRLQGVTGIDTSDILLFADQAAAQAGTSYGALSPAA